MTKLRKCDAVEWRWGAYHAKGKIVERFTETVSRKIKGKEIKRKASKAEPVLLIRQDDGDRVLKRASEVKPLGKA